MAPDDETSETPQTPETPETAETPGAADSTPAPSAPPGETAAQVPPVPAAPTTKKKGKGCLVALLVVLALVVGGGWFGWMWVQDKAEDAGVSLGGGPAGIIPGFGGDLDECMRFQTSMMFLMTSSMFTMGGDEIESELGELRDMAPEAVRGDVQVLADALGEAMQQGLVGATAVGGGEGPSPEEQEANAEKVDEIFESPEVVAAQENINAWAEEHCAVDSNTPVP